MVHELGHISAAIYYRWHIEKVILLPFGGLTIFNEKINRPLKEEFMVLIMGPVFQMLGTIIFCGFSKDFLVADYSKMILVFNLLPIYPLDGAKFLNIILNKFTSFKRAHVSTIYVSLFTICAVLFSVDFNLLLVLIFIFLFIKVTDEYKKRKHIFNVFLLERYFNDFNFRKEKVVSNISKMKRDCRHLFKCNGKYLTERDVLNKMFDSKRKL